MARYRPIYTKIWKEPNIQELSPEEKLLFVYLLTNEQLNESGVYVITPKTIVNETGITLEGVTKGLASGLQGTIEYDNKNNVVWIINFFKYQPKSENCYKSVAKDIRFIKSELMEKFIIKYDIGRVLVTYGIPLARVSIPNPNPMPKHNPIPNPISNHEDIKLPKETINKLQKAIEANEYKKSRYHKGELKPIKI